MEQRMLRINLRAATAGYILRQWRVGCSPGDSLHGGEYRLWLRNPLALYGVENATLALDYRTPVMGNSANWDRK